MKLNVKSITRINYGQYEVQLTERDSNGEYFFTFTVSYGAGEIPVVESSPEFLTFIEMNKGPVIPLLAAVMKFHLAQNIVVCPLNSAV